jgi:hypothetical protein
MMSLPDSSELADFPRNPQVVRHALGKCGVSKSFNF